MPVKRMSAQRRPARRQAKRLVVSGRGGYYMPRPIVGRGASKKRRSNAIRGRGGYISDWFSSAGSKVGNFLGGGVESAIKSITGLGAYKVNKNSLLVPDPPQVVNSSSGVIVRHREYIQDILGTVAFTQQFDSGLPINPGMFKSFPWLSGIANNYTQYKWRGVIFEFIPTSGSAIASTNNALGEVIMATNYNACDALFGNKQQMLNQEFSSSGMPSGHLIHPIECDPKLSTLDKLYTRSGAVGNNQDLRMYDLGLFQLATGGMQVDGINVGELWCTYEVEFFKPQMIAQSDEVQEDAHYWLGLVTDSLPLGTVYDKKLDNLGLSFTSTACTIPSGYVGDFSLMYYIINLTPTAATCVAPSVSISNSTSPNDLSGGAVSQLTVPSNGQSSARFILIQDFKITDPSKPTVITFGTGGTLPIATDYACDFKITRGAFYTTL